MRLRAEVITFMKLAKDYLANDREGDAPVRVIRAEAGLGKSTATLEEIRRALAENENLRVMYAVPSLDLGEELAEKARALGIDARVLRGRGQPRPDGGGTMCAKAEIAETVAALSLSVSDTLCKRKLDSGETVECPFASTCPYLAQMKDAKRGGLLIAAHQYLGVRLEALKDIDVLVIDESFWQTLTRRNRIDLGRFTSLRGVGDGFRGRKGESRKTYEDRQSEADADLGQSVASFRSVIERAEAEGRGPTLADFRAEGFDAPICDYIAGLEYSRIVKPDIHPGQSFEVQKDRLQKAFVQEAFANARVWKILGAELASGREGEPHGLVVRRGVLNVKTGALENVIDLFWSKDPRFANTPTLVIDADADPLITERFYPGASFAEIAAEWRNVRVTQCYDKTGSAQSLSGERRRDEVYNAALDMADRLADEIGNDPAKRPLLVVQKAVEDGYREAGDLPAEGTAGHPFDVAHFGALRGRDGWKAAAGIIVAGRVEPSPGDIEAMARGVWFASADPLTFLQPDPARGSVQLHRGPARLTPREGEARDILVSSHPDPRADRILRQVREAELMQALARIRAIHRGADAPCEVVVLSNIPLPIAVDRISSWAEIVPDRFDMARMAGFVSDKSTDLADAFPELFTSANAVRVAASRREARAWGCVVSHMNLYMEVETPLDWVRVSYLRPAKSGNRRGGAWVRLRAGDTPERVANRVRAFLPDAFEVRCALPEPVASTELVRAAIVRQGVAGFNPLTLEGFRRSYRAEGPDMAWWLMVPPRSKNFSRGRPSLT